jgi:prevent-host-death family protein
MSEQQPTTQTMKISDVKQQLNRLVNQIYRREARIIVEKSGIPVAALVSADDLRRLDRLDQERAERFKVLDEIGAAFKDVPPDELEREVSRALAEVRAERRAEQRETVATGT